MAHQEGYVYAIEWIILADGLSGEHFSVAIIVFCVGARGLDGDTGRLVLDQLTCT